MTLDQGENNALLSETLSLEQKVEKIREQLDKAGYSQEELLSLMKALKLAPKGAQTLSEVPLTSLEMVLTDWDDCEGRLKEARGNHE